MQSLPRIVVAITAAGVLAVLSLWSFQGAEARTPANKYTRRLHIELSEDFYQALKAEGSQRYTTNKSEEYLRRIAVSSRFAVESNLQILNRQEQIIKLLEKLQDKK